MIESIEHGLMLQTMLGFQVITENTKEKPFPFEDYQFDIIEVEHKTRQSLTYLAVEIGDIMNYHQHIKEPDGSKFVKAIIKEINRHVDNKNWELIDSSMVPKGVTVISSVWSIR